MKLFFLILTFFLMGTFLFSCGGNKTSTSSGTAAVTSISSLPGATTPVSSAYSGDPLIGQDEGTRSAAGALRAATTGKVLSAVDISSFDGATAKSRGACEAINMLKTVYESASSPDKIKCYIGVMTDNPTLAGITASTILTDGSYNYFTITQNGSPAGSAKFKLLKNATTGIVESFEMFECMGSTVGTQSGYMNVTLNAGALTMSVKRLHSWSSNNASGDYSSQFDMTGTVSGTSLTAKQLTLIFENAFTSSGFTGSRFGKIIVDEYASTYKLNAFASETGTGTWGTYGFGQAQDVTVFGVLQLLNATPGKMSTLAVGDGSLKAIFNGKNKINNGGAVSLASVNACVATGNPANCWVISNATETNAWTTDVGSYVENATYGASSYGYTEVNASTPATTQTNPTISFGAGESWDCSTVAAGGTMTTITIGSSLQSLMNACDTTYGFGQDGGNINCWTVDDRN